MATKRAGTKHSGSNVEDEFDEELMEITEEDAAFVLGKGGKTKLKICRVSGCEVELQQGTEGPTLRFAGTSKQRRHAKRYAKMVMAQRGGEVQVDEDDVVDDCTILPVPTEAIGFVTGKQGNFLRALEEDYNVLMCFANITGDPVSEDYLNLLIFGSRVNRRGAQLSAMGCVEQKVEDYYLSAWRETGETYTMESDIFGDWGTTTVELREEDLSYALGKKGGTRKKISRATGCVVQYVGLVVFMSGTKRQRSLAEEYLQLLFAQLEGEGGLDLDHRGREDCTFMQVPTECVGYVTGHARETLGGMEEFWGTLMFWEVNKGEEFETQGLYILGPHRARRGTELMVMSAVEKKRLGHFTKDLKQKQSTIKGFATDLVYLEQDEVSYALGAKGTSRKKIEKASGCIFQFVGNWAFIAGELVERKRCRDYLGWLLAQKDGKLSVDVKGRTDVLEVELRDGRPKTGGSNADLRWLEQESDTFCFFAENPATGEERLLIFGHEEGSTYSDSGRLKAERLFKTMVKDGADRHGDYKGGDKPKSGQNWGSKSSNSWGSKSGNDWSGSTDGYGGSSEQGRDSRWERSRSPVARSSTTSSWQRGGDSYGTRGGDSYGTRGGDSYGTRGGDSYGTRGGDSYGTGKSWRDEGVRSSDSRGYRGAPPKVPLPPRVPSLPPKAQASKPPPSAAKRGPSGAVPPWRR